MCTCKAPLLVTLATGSALVSAHQVPANFTSPDISQLLFSLRIGTIIADFGRIKRKKRKRIVYLLTMNQTDLMAPTVPNPGPEAK